MFSFFARKIIYGILVLFGVLTVVFFLFNLSPGDPARNLAGENASEEVLINIRRKFDLDLPLGQRYFLYLNDLSPIALLNPTDEKSHLYFDKKKYSGNELIRLSGHRCLVVKWPYLKRSFLSEKNVSSILGEVLPGTIILAVVSISFALLFGLLLGVWAALKKDTGYDRLILVLSAIGMSGPSFFMAILVAWVGAILWRDHITIALFPFVIAALLIVLMRLTKRIGWLPLNLSPFTIASLAVVASIIIWIVGSTVVTSDGIIGELIHSSFQLPGTGLSMTGSLYSVDVWKGEYLNLRNMILPVITLMIRPLAVIVQLTRSSMLEVLSQDYIRTARAKGLGEGYILFRHALRNALNPVVTAVSGWFASLLAGAVFVEFVFGWKGLGQEMFTAIEKQDLPVVMGGVIVIAFAFVLVNILVDLIYGWIDPRVRIS